MSSSTPAVYVSENISEPMSPQHNFSNNFDLEHTDHAMSAYARIMHEHTKRQLSTAADSARRRSQSITDSESSARSGSIST